jgi:ubiquinone/menaquinone biosynthesis C-methylase UbiE
MHLPEFVAGGWSAMQDDVPGLTDPLILDIGGEGRHARAWNVNPRRLRTLGPARGTPIPRWLAGRADALPLADAVADQIIMEQTPLREAGVREMLRVIRPGGTILLRHAVMGDRDPHRTARRLIVGDVRQRRLVVNRVPIQETVIQRVQKP